MKMHRLQWFAILCLSIACTACGDNGIAVMEGTGVNAADWSGENPVDAKGGVVMYSFTAAAEWTATSNADWCTLLTPSGGAGACSLRLNVEVNTTDQPRTVLLSVQVAGFAQAATFRIWQPEGYSGQGDGRFREINEWMYDYMQSHYLWNEPLPRLPLDYTLDYRRFLTSMLDGVAAAGDLNHEDGVWRGGKRESYYTYIQSSAPTGASAMAAGQTVNGTGIFLLRPARLPDGVVGLAVMAVTPGSPAAAAGLRRGDFITQVDGVTLTMDNYEQYGPKVYDGPVTILPNTMIWNGNQYRMVPREQVQLAAGRYTDPAIYTHRVVTLDNGRKVGYLVYMGFHCDYDRELMQIFDQFAGQGISDLILDLRYNSGGDVLAANVLATLITGRNYKGLVLTNFIYNAARTAAGEQCDLRIGEPVSAIAPGGYAPIEEALDHALGLQTLYVICSATTASASEMLVNGLRGLDIEVRMVGTTTNGKNVGMEGISRKFHSYDYAFYPVTFYTENAKGSRDYADGIVPEAFIDDKGYFPGDFGTEDDTLCAATLSWIITGTKPSISAATLRRATPLGDLTTERLARRMGGCVVHPVQQP